MVQIVDQTDKAIASANDRVLIRNTSTGEDNDTSVAGLAPAITDNLTGHGVGGDKINWSATGPEAGIWWEELGRTTLTGNSASVSVTSFPVRKYLRVIVFTIATGGPNGVQLRFNNDSAANYARRSSTNGAADSSVLNSTTFITTSTTGDTNPLSLVGDLFNVAALEKFGTFHMTSLSADGAGTAPTRDEFSAKWINTSDAITRIDAIATAFSFAAGSSVIILGHD